MKCIHVHHWNWECLKFTDECFLNLIIPLLFLQFWKNGCLLSLCFDWCSFGVPSTFKTGFQLWESRLGTRRSKWGIKNVTLGFLSMLHPWFWSLSTLFVYKSNRLLVKLSFCFLKSSMRSVIWQSENVVLCLTAVLKYQKLNTFWLIWKGYCNKRNQSLRYIFCLISNKKC